MSGAKNGRRPVKYVAELSHVREVSLLGTADLAYWQDRLAKAGLSPVQVTGRAQILISGVDSKYKGFRFRELSISIGASLESSGGRQDGYYLAQAFNSSRFFAFVERAWFQTPYCHAELTVVAAGAASLRVASGGQELLRAEMSADSPLDSRIPVRCGDECWEGPIFLPPVRAVDKSPGKLFFARLAGHTKTYLFEERDTLLLTQFARIPVIGDLLDSEFTPTVWSLRDDATHGKGQTVSREAT